MYPYLPALLLLVLGGQCNHPTTNSQPMIEQTLRMQNEDAQFSAHFMIVSETALQITYQVDNKTGQTLYLFNRLYEGYSKDALLTDKNLAYAFTDRGQTLLYKAIAPVPPDLSVAILKLPCVTKIAPNDAYEEVFIVNLPLMPKSPYVSTANRAKHVIYNTLSFGLGYFVGNSLTSSSEQQTIAVDGPAIYFKTFTYADQKWLRLGPLSEKIMVFEVK